MGAQARIIQVLLNGSNPHSQLSIGKLMTHVVQQKLSLPSAVRQLPVQLVQLSVEKLGCTRAEYKEGRMSSAPVSRQTI